MFNLINSVREITHSTWSTKMLIAAQSLWPPHTVWEVKTTWELNMLKRKQSPDTAPNQSANCVQETLVQSVCHYLPHKCSPFRLNATLTEFLIEGRDGRSDGGGGGVGGRTVRGVNRLGGNVKGEVTRGGKGGMGVSREEGAWYPTGPRLLTLFYATLCSRVVCVLFQPKGAWANLRRT